jgi:hypothetical protein
VKSIHRKMLQKTQSHCSLSFTYADVLGTSYGQMVWCTNRKANSVFFRGTKSRANLEVTFMRLKMWVKLALCHCIAFCMATSSLKQQNLAGVLSSTWTTTSQNTQFNLLWERQWRGGAGAISTQNSLNIS